MNAKFFWQALWKGFLVLWTEFSPLLWTGFLGLPWLKMATWAIFSVVLGVVPLLLKAFFLAANPNTNNFGLSELTSQGELYLTAAFLAATAVGDLIKSRHKAGGAGTLAGLIFGGLCVILAIVGAAAYASVATADLSQQGINEIFVLHTSLWTFGGSVVASGFCVTVAGD
jgi:hypothetical protein